MAESSLSGERGEHISWPSRVGFPDLHPQSPPQSWVQAGLGCLPAENQACDLSHPGLSLQGKHPLDFGNWWDKKVQGGAKEKEGRKDLGSKEEEN